MQVYESRASQIYPNTISIVTSKSPGRLHDVDPATLTIVGVLVREAASTLLLMDVDILLDGRVIVRVAVPDDAVILDVSPTSLAGMAIPTPLLVHGVGI